MTDERHDQKAGSSLPMPAIVAGVAVIEALIRERTAAVCLRDP